MIAKNQNPDSIILDLSNKMETDLQNNTRKKTVKINFTVGKSIFG